MVRSESSVRYLICVVPSKSGVHYRILLSATNQVFAVEIVLFVVKQVSLLNFIVDIESGVHC